MRVNVGIDKKVLIGFSTVTFLFCGNRTGDAKTLFLAHYNQSLDADYSSSNKVKAQAELASVTVDKKGYPFSDSKLSPEAADIGYSTPLNSRLYYDAEGNIDIEKGGTIEFLVKTARNWDVESLGETHPPFIVVPMVTEGEGSNSINVYIYVHAPSGGIYVAFNINDGTDNVITGYNVGPTTAANPGIGWKRDIWHNIAVTWTSTETKLYIDGEIVAAKEWRKLNLTPAKDYIYVGTSPNASASSKILIDELRISDVSIEEFPITDKELGQ